MGSKARQLIRDVRANPWRALTWRSCRDAAAGEVLAQMIDEAIFEMKSLEAIKLACLYQGLAIEIGADHLKCKAEACLGSALRGLGLLEEASQQMQRAEELAAGCDDCLSNLYWRWGVVSCHQMARERGLSLLDRALMHAEKVGDDRCTTNVLLYRSWAHGYFHNAAAGFEDVKRAIGLITPEMPSRCLLTAAVNVLALAVGLGDEAEIRAAVRMIEELKTLAKGLQAHAKARPMLRWIRGLGYEKQGDVKEAVRALESAIRGLERFEMLTEKKAAMADLARIRRKGKQLETNDRHIRRLIEECLRLEQDPATVKVLERARREPSEQNLLAWRFKLPSRVPALEPVPSAGVIA
ncbi:MAG: hypothetical protein HC897_14905 [Thermoanaerobaculia bacterium]|nr:hypothetical protein [Thermoanaerobaculia bacterium]